MNASVPPPPGSGPRRLVVIGNGMAPGRMLERLIEREGDAFAERWQVTIFNAEPRVNYDRLMLSPVLTGEKTFDDIVTHDEAWYERHAIALHRGCRVVAIDRERRTVTDARGAVHPWDDLVIATGSTPNRLPLPGADLDGVMVYRDLDDVERMIDACAACRDVVPGAGGPAAGRSSSAGACSGSRRPTGSPRRAWT